MQFSKNLVRVPLFAVTVFLRKELCLRANDEQSSALTIIKIIPYIVD